ncbi:MAG TPA: hypothetical protein VEJ18_02905 [Planctomycetota bacterium]|nr:hypothetical protein [Planctomycetota bacterium]
MRVSAALVLLAGCAALPPPDRPLYPQRAPLSPAELVSLTQAGLSDDVIIENIEREGVVGGLPSGEADRLRLQGVSDAVIDAYRRGRVVVGFGPLVPAPRRPHRANGALFDPAWYWEDDPWEYPAQVD